MIALALGLGILLLLGVVGAGPSVWLLGRRWRPLWPAFAPIVGFALVVVASDVPSWFLPAPAFAWPLFVVLAGASLAILIRHRRDLARDALPLVALPVLVLPWALAPYLGLDAVTTLSEHNHDWMYYLGLETALGHAGYGSSWHDTGELVHDLGAVLRRGGWRAGISLAGAWISGLTGLAPHQVDGTLWAVLFACFPGAVHAAHRMIVPRASRASQAFVIASAVLSGPALLLLRMSFASHLASLPLFTLLVPAAWRGLTARSPALRALATILLAGSISVLADATPYLAVVGVALVLAAHFGAGVPWNRLTSRAAWALLAPALVPFSIWRIVLSVRSLQVTGYHPPAAHFDATPSALVPVVLGHHVHHVDWSQEPALLPALLVTASLVAGAALVSLPRLRSRALRAVLLVPLAVGAVLALGCDFATLQYPVWKIALTTSPFLTIALGAALDRGAVARGAGLDRTARLAWAAGALLLVAQGASVGAALARAPDPIGILPVHDELVARLASEPGATYMLGHHGDVEAVGHEHALSYLLARHGRALRGVPHPASYLRVSWPRPDLAVRRDERLLVITLDEDRVLGSAPVLLRSGPFVVLEPAPGTSASSITFEAGFLAREEEPELVFRWADAHASLYVDLPTPDSCLSAMVRGTPDGDAPGILVEMRPLERAAFAVDNERELGTFIVPITHDWARRTFAPATGTAQTVRLQLRYLGRRGEERVDVRPIHFALGNIQIRRGSECRERE